MKNKLKNKTIAIMIVILFGLYIILSAPAFSLLQFIAGIGMLIFCIMAIVRLWKQARLVALASILSFVLAFIVDSIPSVASPSAGSFYFYLNNLNTLFGIVVELWVLITLFRMKDAIGAV